jgi:hypothetical protein
MSIAAANVAPDFSFRRKLLPDELKRLADPVVLFEHEGFDSDGVRFFAYTVAGWLDGENVATIQGGCTVGGDVIIIHADDRDTADAIACMGLQDTINMFEDEDAQLVEAAASLARLQSVGATDRVDLATAAPANRSDAFERDMQAIRKLRGDDILLSAGGVAE